jgi:NAD(P)-dependent dehydrogenase (short-subunit alcohol dehydrogenase family)
VRIVLLALALLAVAAGAAVVVVDREERVVARAQDAVERRIPTSTPPLEPARCPADAQGCRVVTGRVVLIESVDPDGDGDLHVVVADAGITAPGVTSIDVRPGLRPRRDPRVGDRFSAAGPVQRGSYGQAQVHALDVAVARR